MSLASSPGQKAWCVNSDAPCQYVTVMKVDRRRVTVRLPRFGYGNIITVAPSRLHATCCPRCPKGDVYAEQHGGYDA